MIWMLTTQGASTRLRDTPFTETPVQGVGSIVYKPGIAATPATGADPGSGELGTFTRGLHRTTGFVFSYDGSVAETLFAITAPIDLIVRYQTDAEVRKRTFLDVLFVGDATVALPTANTGVSELIGVPFRVQIPATASLGDHIVDEQDV